MLSQTSVTLGPDPNVTDAEAYIGVRLEQEPEEKDGMTLRDVYQMWLLAKSGISARNYNPYGTQIKFTETTVTFSLGFYVWPLPIEHPYELSTTLGEISEGIRFTRNHEDSYTFTMSETVELKSEINNFVYEWETPTINREGSYVPHPTITLVNGQLQIPNAVFGVARVNLVEEGFRHEVEVTLTNVDADGNNIAIDNVKITITASWENLEGDLETEELTLEIPKALLAALTMCNGKPNMVCQSCDDWIINIYFNTCDGNVLETRIVDLSEEGGSWCLPTG